MIKRIVKMIFREESVETFLHDVFEHSKDRIRAFPGCRHMELLRNLQQPNILFTLSYWDDEAALEAYRQSELFQTTWAKTKVLFAGKAEAWTVEMMNDER